jgi:hypothetical protein
VVACFIWKVGGSGGLKERDINVVGLNILGVRGVEVESYGE